MKTKKLKQINKDLINKQFEIANINLTYDELIKLNSDDWFIQNTMSTKQHEDFKKWAVKYIKKELKMSVHSATKEFAMWDLNFGLKLNDYEL